ncbi:MAG: beta-N-acetylglucosaminidase domain-containing protein [Coriobacteriaceae bacterium]|nr:beta-N-acetylglucosaminidase domain-containing protein [Coriobacteriaceae bacterium]
MKVRGPITRGAATLGAIIALSGVAAVPASAWAADAPTLLPEPVHMETRAGTVDVSAVELVGTDVADKDAVAAAKQILKDAGITVTDRTAAEGATGKVPAIYISESDDAFAARDAAAKTAGVGDAKKLGSEGYVLGVDPASKTLVLTGHDGDGTYYAAQTLRQLLNGKSVAGIRISDEPTVTTRGTIEGFYARGQEDWSWEDRMEQVRFYGQTKMNTYIYAPKEDPYHRDRWREPYPADQMEKMRALVKEAAKNKVDFVFAISPGTTINLSSESDYQALTNKCKTMYDAGVRHFAVFFDDINNKDGVAQAKLLNRFNKEFIKGQAEACTLVTVPTEYDSNAMLDGADLKQYSKDFSANLDKDIEVLWTGSSVVPDGISAEDAAFIKRAYGDRAGIWWNYPCNDYQLNKLAMGPIHGIVPEVFDTVDYFVMNPMGRADLSRVTLATGADMSWNLKGYDEDASLKDACDLIYPGYADAALTFATHSSQVFGASFSCGRPDGIEVRKHADAMMKEVASLDDPATSKALAAFKADMAKMVDAAGKLTQGDFAPVQQFVGKMRSVGEAGQKAADLLVAKAKGDTSAVNTLTSSLNGVLPSLKSGKLVSDRCVVSVVEEALAYQVEPSAGFTVSSTLIQKGKTVRFENKSSVSATEYEWSLPGSVEGSSHEENPEVTYTKPGRYEATLTVRNKHGEDTVTKKDVVYVVDSLPASMENLARRPGVKAEASSYTNGAEGPAKAIDGIVTGSKWCASGNGGHTLTIDLGKSFTLTKFRMLHAEAGGEGSSANTRAYTISLSNDKNSGYREVVRVTDNTKGITEDAIAPTSGRYIRLTVNQAVQPGTQWPATRIFEFEAYGAEVSIDGLPEYVAPNTGALERELAEVGKLDGSQYTDPTWKALDREVKASRALLSRGDKTQAEVDAQLKKLQDARRALAPRPTFTVTFAGKGVSLDPVEVIDGHTVKKPADPVREGYTFEGWFSGEQKFDFTKPVTGDVTLTARWSQGMGEVGPSRPVERHTVTFTGKGVSLDPVEVIDGHTVKKPADPVREGYTFEGWFSGEQKFDFTKPVTGDVTLTARWSQGSSEVIPCFPDVTDRTEHMDDIYWLARTGVTTGFPDGTFRPYASVTRCDMAAFLYRLVGEPDFEPTAEQKARFKDVDAGTDHAKEIWWLAAKEISTGFGDGTFRPMDTVKRQDMAAFLHRLSQKFPAEKGARAAGFGFADVTADTPHAEDIAWLAATGVSEGWQLPDGGREFRGMSDVARGDMAAFLHRMDDKGLVHVE